MGINVNNEYPESSMANPDQLEYMEYENEQHPSIEMMLLREAIQKGLMIKQRELWEMYVYDRLNTEEIAKKLKTTRQNVSQRLKVIERKLQEYCQKHRMAYLTLKEAENDDSCGC